MNQNPQAPLRHEKVLLLGPDGEPDGMETQIQFIISDGLDGRFEVRCECGRNLVVRAHDSRGDETTWIEEEQLG